MACVSVEARAKVAWLGVWATGFEQPSDYRHKRGAAAGSTPAPDSRCAIKGNINVRGDRIYHLPGSWAYPVVRIDTDRGER